MLARLWKPLKGSYIQDSRQLHVIQMTKLKARA